MMLAISILVWIVLLLTYTAWALDRIEVAIQLKEKVPLLCWPVFLVLVLLLLSFVCFIAFCVAFPFINFT